MIVLSNGIEIIPGEGHNLQEFSKSLIQEGGAKELSGINFSVVQSTKDTDFLLKQEKIYHTKKLNSPDNDLAIDDDSDDEDFSKQKQSIPEKSLAL
ncbi:30S ribosomal protein S12 [Gigaspora margarita]|uniref:30S ribosomal protein S12 n=1 Tax=Gigaspora margarita TaxID=4874 RepID=A0A8H3X5T2_GIGMA|nr:30S ribosomal protein S12 [Gigaspora margarita]